MEGDLLSLLVLREGLSCLYPSWTRSSRPSSRIPLCLKWTSKGLFCTITTGGKTYRCEIQAGQDRDAFRWKVVRRCRRMRYNTPHSQEEGDHLIRHLPVILSTLKITFTRTHHKGRHSWSELFSKRRFRLTTAILREMWERSQRRRISLRSEGISRTWLWNRNLLKRSRRIVEGRSQSRLEKYQPSLMCLMNRPTGLQILSKRWREGRWRKEGTVASRMSTRRIELWPSRLRTVKSNKLTTRS